MVGTMAYASEVSKKSVSSKAMASACMDAAAHDRSGDAVDRYDFKSIMTPAKIKPSEDMHAFPPAKKRRRISLLELVEDLEAAGQTRSCRIFAEAAAATAAAAIAIAADVANSTDTYCVVRVEAVIEADLLVGAGTAEAERSLCEAAAGYPPLAKCLERLHYLSFSRHRKKARRWLAVLALRLGEATIKLMPKGPSVVRFVAISDTHRFHDQIDLPEGEVLLHAGDFTGNYGRSSDLEQHMDEFLAWLLIQSRKFKAVFLTAGNHETLLDDHHADVAPAFSKLDRFLQAAGNCRYLQNSEASYRGLKIFGSPVTVSRLEYEGKRYYSRAFERTADERYQLWKTLPEGLDVLMTHCPPRGRLCKDAVGDPELTARCRSMAKPPKFHVFGHDHKNIGALSDGRTTFVNVAQDECLRNDPNGGGCPFMFDIEVP